MHQSKEKTKPTVFSTPEEKVTCRDESLYFGTQLTREIEFPTDPHSEKLPISGLPERSLKFLRQEQIIEAKLLTK